MGEMRDSDWSRENLLRSDWLVLQGAIMTTLYHVNFETLNLNIIVSINDISKRGPCKSLV